MKVLHRIFRIAFKITLGAALVWMLAGLALVILVPFAEDSLLKRVNEETGLSLSLTNFGGYFYFYKAGVRLTNPQIADEHGSIVEGQEIRLEFNPLGQWFSGHLLPMTVNADGLHIIVQMHAIDHWTLQHRFDISGNDQPALVPGPATATTDDLDSHDDAEPDDLAIENIDMSQLEIGSELDDALRLFEQFGGRINITNARLTLQLLPTGVSRTLEQINITVQGGSEPELTLAIDSPTSYSRFLGAALRIDRSNERYLRIHYDVSLQDFNRVFFDDFFPGSMVFGDINASINLRGSINPVHQSLQFSFDIAETRAIVNARPPAPAFRPVFSLRGKGRLGFGDNAYDIHLPLLQFINGYPSLEEHILVENFTYSDTRVGAEPDSIDVELDRLRIDKDAVLALIEIKNRLAPGALNEIDDFIADIDVRKFQLSCSLVDKTISDAGGQVQINYLQIDPTTHFSNLNLYVSDYENALKIQTRASASTIAIAEILEPVNIHAIRNMDIQLSAINDNWFFSADAPGVEITPDQSLDIYISIEFQTGFSPWIRMRYSGTDLPVDVVQTYVPRLLLGPGLDRWLWQALPDGLLESGSVEYGGNILLSEPAIRPEIFALDLKFSQVNLQYHPDWPTLNDVAGRVQLNDSKVEFNIGGSYIDTRVVAQGSVDNFDSPRLKLSTDVQGEYKKLQDFINDSPLAPLLEGFFDQSSGSGVVLVNAQADIGLDDNGEDTYGGYLQLGDFGLELVETGMQLNNIYGRIYFDQDSLHSVGLQAQFGSEVLHAQLDTVYEMDSPRISVEITTVQNPGNILGLETLLNTIGMSGTSAWYMRYLSPSITTPPDDRPPTFAELSSYFYFYSDFIGVDIAENSSINKKASEFMPVSLVLGDSEYGGRVVWVLLDDKIDARIFLDLANADSLVAAGHVRIYNPDDGEKAPQISSAAAPDGLVTSREMIAAPSEAAVPGQLVPLPPSTVSSLLSDLSSTDLRAVRDKSIDMLTQVQSSGFYDTLIDNEVIIEGNMDSILLEPWTQGFTSVTSTDVEPAVDAEVVEAEVVEAPDSPKGVTPLIFRISVGVNKVNAFGLDFNAVAMDFTLADDSIFLSIDSDESRFSIFYDILGRDPIQIDVSRLLYRLKKSEEPDDLTLNPDADGAVPNRPQGDGDGDGDAVLDPTAAANCDADDLASESGQGDVICAPETPPTAGRVETDTKSAPDQTQESDALAEWQKNLQIFESISELKKIDFYCRRCQFNDVLIRDAEGLIEAKGNWIEASLRYATIGVEDQISIKASWYIKGDQMSTQFIYDAVSLDLYRSITNHGVGTPLGGQGQIKFLLRWQDAPFTLHYPSLGGFFDTELVDGVIYDIGSSSTLRLLSMMNLLEIPRRFSLDFGDLGQNLEFYRASVSASIDSGIVRIDESSPLHLRSSLGTMDAFGDIDLTNRQYNIGAHVVPIAVTYTAPVIALLFAGPIGGISVIGLSWMLGAFGVDVNQIAEQYNLVESSFDSFELKTVSSERFREWARELKAAPSPESVGQQGQADAPDGEPPLESVTPDGEPRNEGLAPDGDAQSEAIVQDESPQPEKKRKPARKRRAAGQKR